MKPPASNLNQPAAALSEKESDESALAWFCLQSKPQKERYALTHLQRQQIETVLPMARFPKISGSQATWRIAPLFPRYLFFRHHPDVSFSPIQSTRGVASIVAFGGKPAVVPDEVVREVRSRAIDGVIELDEPELKEGSPVRILGGPYEGMEAVFQRNATDHDRVVVLLDIMASVAKVSIDRNFLEIC